jgi:LysM repeat protein
LGVIAENYGVDANELARVNNISNWNLLRVGQELIIPGVTRRDVAELRGQIHVVQSGESLSQIAAQYGIDVDDLIALNEIIDPNAIRVGTELIIAE